MKVILLQLCMVILGEYNENKFYNHILGKRRVGEDYNLTCQAEKYATSLRSLLHLNLQSILPTHRKESKLEARKRNILRVQEFFS